MNTQQQVDGGIVSFQLNVPQVLQLEFGKGMDITTKFGEKVMFSLTDGRRMFLTPEVATKLHELNPRAGETIQVLKRETRKGNRQGVEWVFTQVDTNPVPPPVVSKPRPQLVGEPTPQRADGTLALAKPAQQPGMPNPAFTENLEASLTASLMATCLKQSIDALSVARKHAAAQGWDLEFFGEDVRAMANALFIHRTKGGAQCK